MKIIPPLFLLFFALSAPVPAQWSEPVLVDTPWDSLGVNSPGKDWCPFVTIDNQYMYLASEWGDSSATDIYVSRWTGTSWGSRKRLPFCLPDVDERNPTVNATNDTLYFIRYGGGWDIWWSFRTGSCDTCWGEPERMPEPINSPGIEFSVWCTPDNQRLLLSTTRGGNMEDIYECRRDAGTLTGWSTPTPLPGRLNTFSMESYPSMGRDTTELFFWGRYWYLYRAVLTDSGWTRGDSLPYPINRVIGQYPSERTPAISADGSRLYYSSRWTDTTSTAGDVWFVDRPVAVTPRPSIAPERQGLLYEVYPNPTRDGFTVRTGPLRELVLYDVLGRRIATRTLNGQSGLRFWPLREDVDLPSGTYYLVGQLGTVKEAVPIHILK